MQKRNQLLALGAVATVIVAIGTKQPPSLIIAIIGLISVLIAGYAGLTFFINGPSQRRILHHGAGVGVSLYRLFYRFLSQQEP